MRTEQSQLRYALSQLAHVCITEYRSLPHGNVLRLDVKFVIEFINISDRLGGKFEESYNPVLTGGNGAE
jgi:hypothetical protein